ncbi:MAG: hypothetical protein MUC50_20355, partial [Myxococcota bacterium]|nr:hypothetical protein [Myxococcota bacterium]
AYTCGGGVVDNCPNDPNKTEPGQCGCGVPEGTCGGGKITHVGTTKVWDSNGQGMTISRPSGSATGDLLVLILHRTDNYLPLSVSGWTRVAECLKRDNPYNCSTAADCTNWNSNSAYCDKFGDYGQKGQDLAQAVYYRVVGGSEAGSYTFNFKNKVENGKEISDPAWVILTALRGAATSNPVRDWHNTGNDHNSDTVFPSVYGQTGDMLLLSQSFDDTIAQSKFGAPDGTTTFGYVSQSDEAGFLFGGILNSTGETGTKKTNGDGGPSDKDISVSLTIKPK